MLTAGNRTFSTISAPPRLMFYSSILLTVFLFRQRQPGSTTFLLLQVKYNPRSLKKEIKYSSDSSKRVRNSALLPIQGVHLLLTFLGLFLAQCTGPNTHNGSQILPLHKRNRERGSLLLLTSDSQPFLHFSEKPSSFLKLCIPAFSTLLPTLTVSGILLTTYDTLLVFTELVCCNFSLLLSTSFKA